MSNNSAAQILATLGPSCRDATRRARLLAQAAFNGIDFIEFETVAGVHRLLVHFLLDLPAGAYGLVADPSPMLVLGGTRIIGVGVLGAAISGTDARVLVVRVDAQGDYSPYLLAIGWARDGNGLWRHAFGPIDRQFSVAPINFRPGCPVDFDCAPVHDCPPELLPEPMLDYLARDYASFRQLLIDLVAQRNPSWVERSPADLGITLLELFAHEGDHLAYFQDAVANEAYLDTARQRVSAKRHARLIDYAMHDGRNAWTWVHLAAASAGRIGPGRQLITRINQTMRFDRQPGVVPVPQPVAPPGTRLNEVTDADHRTDPALAQVRVFETAASARIDPLNNELRVHAWGNEQCCLARGTTTAHLYAVNAAGTTAVRPPLVPGDLLLLEELRSPVTGALADADPTHRQVVQIEQVGTTLVDGLFLAALDPITHEPQPVTVPVLPPLMLPLLEVSWRAVDALDFALCLTARLADGTVVPRVSVARGNIVLADHGRSLIEAIDFKPPLEGDPGFRLRLAQAPLTLQSEPADQPAAFPPVRERSDLAADVRQARPALALQAWRQGVPTGDWWPVPDLLSSSEFDRHFVADVDNEGRAVLRFGDGEYGRRLIDVDRVEAWYRVGNGRAGNIGADALAHIVEPFPPPLLWPTITAVRNPLPAQAGVDPELIEQVRQYAPVAFRAQQYRAVTEADYQQAALTIAGVAGAVASFRWTGSWITVFIGIDPVHEDDVLTDARGVTRLAPAFRQHVEDELTRYRLAGYDLEIRSARYVPLDLSIQLCAKPGYFAADVARAVALALSAGTGPGGVPGLFNAANFSFGQPVYLSRIYAAVEAVDGVDSASVTVFQRHGRAPAGELQNGVLPIGAWEIVQLDNDPSNMEHGTLTLTAGGGS